LEIENALARNVELFKAIPAIRPSTGTLSSNSFGIRRHPILGIYKMHNGIDIMTDPGTPVYVTGDGKVDYVGRKGGFGLCIEVEHGFGYRTVYAHLSSSFVKEGQKVKRGTQIAKSGNSGLSSGPHLHYEVILNGINQDPAEYFFDNFGIFKAEK
jgi:murein DD-endopeptidase MepM/ murein hydrolase activator NlpD